jgi:translocation and assembly module TamB
MPRGAKFGVWTLAVSILLVAVLGGGVLILGNTAAGRGMIERLTSWLTGGTVQLAGLGGTFPTRLTLERLQLVDHDGVWLTADRLAVTWSPLALLAHRIEVASLQVARLHVERGPVSNGSGHGGAVSFPTIDVAHATLPVVELGAPLVGKAVSLSLQGGLRLRSLDDADADLDAHRLGGDGDYTLHLHLDPKRLDAALAVHEPASGPLENLLGLPGLGPLVANVSVRGPRTAEAVDVVLAAGELHALVKGSVDLPKRTADLTYSLDSPALAPRADLDWGAVVLAGNWHGDLSAANASGHLQIDRLRLAGATRVARLTADLTAAGGRLALSAAAQGLEIPGPQSRFFAAEPLQIDAAWQQGAASRPLDLTLTHPLVSIHAHADTVPATDGSIAAVVALRIPELAAYSVFTGQDVRGDALVNARLTHRADDDALALDATLGLTGGSAPWVHAAGPHVTLELGGSLTAATLELDHLKLAMRALTLSAGGSIERITAAAGAAAPRGAAQTTLLERFAKQLQAHWQLDAPDLAALSADLAGNLKLSGTVAGTPTAMTAAAEMRSHLSVRGSPDGSLTASLRARGLPGSPSGTLQASGSLDGSPLYLDAALEQSGAKAFRMTVRRADWKSAHLDGDLTTDAKLTQSHGQMTLNIAQLGDLDRLLGVTLTGSAQAGLRFMPGHGETQAEFNLDGTNLKLGQLAGNVHASGSGVANAIAMQMTAKLADSSGVPGDLAASADLDLTARKLELASASLGYHGQTLKLLAPAHLSFAAGVDIDEFKLGVDAAVFTLHGRLTPALDLQASLTQVRPALINAFTPGLLVGGLLEARAQLTGSLAHPSGQIRLDASDILFADDAATGLPPLQLHASADLDGDTAAVSAKLEAGAASQLTASGNVPLDAAGALDLKIGGKLDVSMANPLLEARGMRASGDLTADADVTGSLADPQVGGGITLARGTLRDFGHGLTLTDIAADIVGRAGALEIKSFTAKAGSGNMAMSGSFGLLQSGLPLDLKITAKNAQPITSSILTANLDADVRVSGTVRQRIDVDGTVHVNRATIGIPDSLPPDVAVLDVRRRGHGVQVPPPRQLVIGIDIAIKAPHQILVEGRGLDAEMGGDIFLKGTSDALVASGGLDLQRGSFTIAGNKLTFSPDSKIGFDGAGLTNKIDPTLDFTAQSTIGTTTATLHITGVADAPRFDFTSTPELPPDQIMALLLFGQPAAQLSAVQIAQVGYALATLSGVGGGGVNPLVKLQKALGLDRLNVGTNTVSTAAGSPENSGYAIAAGRYVTKRIYIEGKQTTTGTSQVQVDVDLTKRLKLQTRLGNGTATVQGTTPENDPGSSIGLIYQFEY